MLQIVSMSTLMGDLEAAMRCAPKWHKCHRNAARRDRKADVAFATTLRQHHLGHVRPATTARGFQKDALAAVLVQRVSHCFPRFPLARLVCRLSLGHQGQQLLLL